MNERNGFSIAGIPFIVVCLVLVFVGIGLFFHLSASGLPPWTGAVGMRGRHRPFAVVGWC